MIGRRGTSRVLTYMFLTVLTTGAVNAGEPPVVLFDLPKRLVAHEVIEPGGSGLLRLVEVTVPVSARVAEGDVGKVQEITVEIDGRCAGLIVHDFAPQTTLGSELAGDIHVTTTTEKAHSFEASLGGQSPIPLGDVVAQVTPSLSGGLKNRQAETKTTSRLAPKRPVVVSGTLNEGHGTFFQLRPSSQTTLEGQHQLSVVFRVPDDWVVSRLEVRCWARGERQVLWFDQPQIWGSTQRTVSMALAGLEPTPPSARHHLVAKQPTEDADDNWVPAQSP